MALELWRAGTDERRAAARLLRRLGLAGLADELAAVMAARAARPENEAWIEAHPNAHMPPPRLVYEVSGQALFSAYAESGLRHARAIAAACADRFAAPPRRVLEWGCGPGRIIQHLPALLGLPASAFVGVDPNRASINFARAAFADMLFQTIRRDPPTGLPAGGFDLIYGVSILTHLPERAAHAWIGELHRLCAPGGLCVLTLHREGGVDLSEAERARLAAGGLVERAGAPSGSRAFAAYHSAAAMERLIDGCFSLVARETGEIAQALGQEAWVLRAL
jgi:SAM-dependent methyltransferase